MFWNTKSIKKNYEIFSRGFDKLKDYSQKAHDLIRHNLHYIPDKYRSKIETFNNNQKSVVDAIHPLVSRSNNYIQNNT